LEVLGFLTWKLAYWIRGFSKVPEKLGNLLIRNFKPGLREGGFIGVLRN